MIGTALRPLGRGLRDTFDHLLPFLWLSVSWWIGVFLVVTAPAATIALFRATDPRALEDHHRPTRREILGQVRARLLSGWQLGLALAVPVLVLVYNIVVYQGSAGVGQWLVPLWAALLLLTVTVGGIAVSLVALHGRSTPVAIRQAIVITLSRLPRLLPVVLVLWVLVAVGGLLAVPAVTFIPTLVAVTFNHVTYEALGIVVADAMEPTPELIAEGPRTEAGRYSTN